MDQGGLEMKKLIIGLLATIMLVAICAEAAQGGAWVYRAKRDGWLTVWGTINCQVIEPPALDRTYVLRHHVYFGFLPPGSNDFLTKFEWDASCGNVDWIKFGIPFWNGVTWELTILDEWIGANLSDGGLRFPTMGDSSGVDPDIYIMIDVETWFADPRPEQNEYTVVDGVCDDLPGYLIGTTPIVFDPNAPESGYPFSTTLYTGTLHNDGEITLDLSPRIPSMTTYGIIILIALMTLSAVWIFIRRRKKAVA
jgi:hypothetical protein